MNKRCLLIGMGGHSKVVADVARKCGYEIIGCLDDRAPESTAQAAQSVPTASSARSVASVRIAPSVASVSQHTSDHITITNRTMLPYLGPIAEFKRFAHEDIDFFIAIGNNAVRKNIAERLTEHGVCFATLIDPSAIISDSAVIEPGTVIMPGVIINADVHIGQHAIINTGATIDHDCWISHFAHVSPGAHLAGGVHVGNLVHVGIGSSIIQNIHIGTGAIIGAGAAVIRDIPPYTTAVGVPARVIQSHHPQQE